MDLKNLRRRQTALETLIAAENTLAESQYAREAIIEGLRLDTGQQEALANDFWNRGVHIIGRFLAARTDGEVFHTLRRTKEVRELSGYQGCRQRADYREEITKENRRDITVAGLGMITVSRVHEITDWMTKTGRTLESEKTSKYSVVSKEPEVDEWMMATAFGAQSERRATWPLDSIAVFDEEEEGDPAQANISEIAHWAESVESLEHIAEVVGVEFQPPVFQTEDLLD